MKIFQPNNHRNQRQLRLRHDLPDCLPDSDCAPGSQRHPHKRFHAHPPSPDGEFQTEVFHTDLGNMFSAAGNRIAFQRNFNPGAQEETKENLQRSARGNSLFENAGDGTFRDVSESTGVTMGRWSWASVFADINNDGWEDLLVSNGYLTRTKDRDL